MRNRRLQSSLALDERQLPKVQVVMPETIEGVEVRVAARHSGWNCPSAGRRLQPEGQIRQGGSSVTDSGTLGHATKRLSKSKRKPRLPVVG